MRLPAATVEALMQQLLDQPGARLTVDLPNQAVTGPDGEIHRFGYRQLLTLEDSILSSRGQFYRGHEFHWSRITGHNGDLKPAYQMQNADGDVIGYEGFVAPNLLASYVHLHFGQNPVLVDKFVQHCREYASVRSAP